MIKAQQFNQIQGMNMDISPSKRPPTLAYQIKNMRITIEEANTLMSWSNEKGTQQLIVYDMLNPKQEFHIEGKVLGTCVLNNYLVLFVHNDYYDCIQGINFNEVTPIGYTFFKGNLNFKENSVFETLGVYEKETVQKIYWIDGVNQPRFINIAGDLQRIKEGPNTQFDFLPTDGVIPQVEITKRYETGYFQAGTIQYAFAYYNYYGQQTNLFYISPIQYISFDGIGAGVDALVSCSFEIKIKKESINTNFDMIRVFSISRTATDIQPKASIVKDIEIKRDSEGKVVLTDDIIFIDNNDTGTAIDYSQLLFMNNTPIVPNTMDQKDNTLFLGNFKYETIKDLEIKECTQKILDQDPDISKFISFQKVPLLTDSKSQYYPYTNQLQFNSTQIAGFKGGEWYLFGYIVQDINDRWSSVVPLGNVYNDVYPKVELTGNTYTTYIVQAVVSPTLVDSIYTLLRSSFKHQFKAIKFVIVAKTEAQRNVLCQGIVNPTVYCYENRVNKEAPFAQASWFFRPMMKHTPDYYQRQLGDTNTQQSPGGVSEFRHLASLGHYNLQVSQPKGEDHNHKSLGIKTITPKGNVEIQSMIDAPETLINVHFTQNDILDDKPATRTLYGVDQSIVTFNSPDIEFNDTMQLILDRREDLQFRIIGYTKLKSTNSNYDITSEDLTFVGKDIDCIYKADLNINKIGNTFDQSIPAAGLHNIWGTHVRGYRYQDELKNINTASTAYQAYYPVYPWQRSSSLTDQTQPSEEYNYVLPLKTKIMSNIRFCMETHLFSEEKKIWKKPITPIHVFNTGRLYIRIPNYIEDECTYYGDVDTLITHREYAGIRYYIGPWYKDFQDTTLLTHTFSWYDFNFYGKLLPSGVYLTEEGEKSIPEGRRYIQDPIRMKYKSSQHAVFGFKSFGSKQTILPQISAETLPTYYKETAKWNMGMASEDPDLFNKTEATKKEENIQIIDTDFDITTTNIANYLREKYGTPNEYGGVTTEFEGILIVKNATITLNNLTYYTALPVSFKEVTVSEKPAYSHHSSNEIRGVVRPFELEDNVIYTHDDIQLYKVKDRAVGTYYVRLNDNQSLSSNTSGPLYTSDIYDVGSDDGIFYIGEVYAPNKGALPTTNYDLQTYSWQIASEAIPLDGKKEIHLFGDTYFQRYDCLKTYPFTDEDPNQIVDIGSFMVETYINIDGRYDRNRGLLDNTNIVPTNFNQLNKAYTQHDKFLTSYINDRSFDVNNFPNTVTWTLTKVFGQDIDAWTHLTNTSIMDLEGNHGKLTKLINFQNNMLFFQDTAVGVIRYNENAALSTEKGLPVELGNSGKVTGKEYINGKIGCQNKRTIISTKHGLYFIDGNTQTIYAATQPQELAVPKGLSDNAFDTYLQAQEMSTARSFYNQDKQDVYFVFDNFDLPCLTYNEQTDQFTSFYDYNPEFIENIKDICYHIKNSKDTAYIWKQNLGEYNYFYTLNSLGNPYDLYSPFYITIVCNGEQAEATTDKIFNNLEFRSDTWSSDGKLKDFTTFDLLEVANEYQYGCLALRDIRQDISNDKFGDKRQIDIPSNLKKKFRIWRSLFPRAQRSINQVYLPNIWEDVSVNSTQELQAELPNKQPMTSRDRIRNTWTYVSLKKTTPNTDRLVLHDMIIYYYS